MTTPDGCPSLTGVACRAGGDWIERYIACAAWHDSWPLPPSVSPSARDKGGSPACLHNDAASQVDGLEGSHRLAVGHHCTKNGSNAAAGGLSALAEHHGWQRLACSNQINGMHEAGMYFLPHPAHLEALQCCLFAGAWQRCRRCGGQGRWRG